MADARLPNTFIHLLGMPGTGKYTIAREIAARADVRIVDNHLINNPVFTVVRVDGRTALPQKVWDYTADIGRIVFDCIRTLSPPDFSFVLTNALCHEQPEDHAWFAEVMALAAARGALFVPVRLLLSDIGEHRRRMTDPQRETRMKETDATAPDRYARQTVLHPNHPHLLTMDVTPLTAADAATEILAHAAALHAAAAPDRPGSRARAQAPAVRDLHARRPAARISTLARVPLRPRRTGGGVQGADKILFNKI